jgi:hypothetical protein
MEMKITVCENRFEVVCGSLDWENADDVLNELAAWLIEKVKKIEGEPSEEDYMAALGPCGK